MVIENERPVAATLGYVPNAQDLSAYGSGVALNFCRALRGDPHIPTGDP